MLEDTSFAIHPGQNTEGETTGFYDIGNIERIEKERNGLSIQTNTGELKVVVYRDGVIRFAYNPFGNTNLKGSPAIIAVPDGADFSMTEEESKITLTTKKLQVDIKKQPVRITIKDSKGNILLKEERKGMGFTTKKDVGCFKEMAEDDYFYGFGEKTGYLNKRGEKLEMWNTDVYAPHNPETDPLYQSIPFFITLNRGISHGIFFDNTYKTFFDFQTGQDVYSFSAEGGQLDYYFLSGPTPKDVIMQYTDLTGRMPIPPKWTLGYHQSRYSYETEGEVREIIRYFQEKAIPLDAIYLDIHYMDGFRVFTFDKSRFPNPKALVSDLKEQGIRVVPIVDPGVKEDPEYAVFQEGILEDRFCQYIDGKIYYGDVWPGNSAFPDFANSDVRKWWGEKHKFYKDLGIEGIWNDMNEPAVFNETKTMDVKVIHNDDGVLKTHREMHNLYGLLMGEATYTGMKDLLEGKRPFLLTRAGYSGVQRYAAVWTGDNRSFWEHLQLSVPMIMNLGLSGVPFAGADVGGFAHHSNGELLARWIQVGAFTPFFRNHSAIGFLHQEPWSFGEKYEKIIKKYIGLRYKWLPQLYTLFAEAHEKGIPVMRPLLLEYPDDATTYNMNDQFMLGDNTIVAPIMQPSTNTRAVYLPEGQWVDYWTDEILKGKQYHLVTAPLDTLPIFIKRGTAIAHGDEKGSTAVQDEKLTLHLYYEDKTGTIFRLYEDDGSTFDYEAGTYLWKTFHVNYNGNEIKIRTSSQGQFKSSSVHVEFVIHSYREHALVVNIDEKVFSAEKKDEKTFSVTI